MRERHTGNRGNVVLTPRMMMRAQAMAERYGLQPIVADYLTDDTEWYLNEGDNMETAEMPQWFNEPNTFNEGVTTTGTNAQHYLYATDTAEPEPREDLVRGHTADHVVYDEASEVDSDVFEGVVQAPPELRRRRREPQEELSHEEARARVDSAMENGQRIPIYVWERGIKCLTKDLIIDYMWGLFQKGYRFNGAEFYCRVEQPMYNNALRTATEWTAPPSDPETVDEAQMERLRQADAAARSMFGGIDTV